MRRRTKSIQSNSVLSQRLLQFTVLGYVATNSIALSDTYHFDEQNEAYDIVKDTATSLTCACVQMFSLEYQRICFLSWLRRQNADVVQRGG
jgi:hypothetical protein